jgi:adenosylhomocysteine nucleosidase
MDTFAFTADVHLSQEMLQIERQQDEQVVLGRIVSGDQFINDSSKASFLHEHFGALACEMEGAAIAQVCYLNQMPFVVVRSLSDMAGQVGNAARSFHELKFMAAAKAATVTKHLIERLSNA